jgi:hypothetical protein
VSSVRPENDIYISQARIRLAGFFETGGSHFLAFAGGTTSAMAAKPVKDISSGQRMYYLPWQPALSTPKVSCAKIRNPVSLNRAMPE